MQSRQVSGEGATKINMAGVTVHSQRELPFLLFLAGGNRDDDDDGWVLHVTVSTYTITSLIILCRSRLLFLVLSSCILNCPIFSQAGVLFVEGGSFLDNS